MGIRTGQQYKEGLRSPREVYINGERVTDVTQYPAFRRPIEAIAKLYDMKHDPRHQATLTFPSPTTGDLCDICFMPPKNAEELRKKTEAYKLFAKSTYGVMGRSPEFMNAHIMGIAESSKFFGKWGQQFEDNMNRYFEYVRENDLFLTHALGTPQIDRSKASHEQRDLFLHLGVKEETEEGIIVRGAKQLATMGPITDELLVFPNGRAFKEGDERYCMAFAIPVSTPGLKMLCRQPFVPNDDRNVYDHPFSSRFEENDAMVVFDDVLVPWERVFFYNNIEAANTMRFNADVSIHATHQATVRKLVKFGMAAAIASKLTDSVKTNVFPQVAERVGIIIAMLKSHESALFAAEQCGEYNDNGNWRPNKDFLEAQNILYSKNNEVIVDLIKQMGAAGLMLTPSGSDFFGPESENFQYYFSGANSDGFHRVQIAKMAWDFFGDAATQRLLHYERFYIGDPMFYAAGYSNRANIREWLDLTDELLAQGREQFSAKVQ
ncbi:4-hydroxyphenylacetate 3-hydroxylase N-terminal domain-containing protein [Brevibacillus nitrificans]|uniref:4-hydroxyphenylacetate 3-hydroxylase family protein n=1 Tax=Brevibacillus nitrificans TaxID=651560 RepID=UPI002E1C2D69|nr:4-hydroxyphenylacetate 3-hydroxylase N-terminal domain-containing protein [Brevibacillus nitrificans]